ncbi:MAG: ribonuclease P protein component [Myxococcaceae bacterium]|nr:ribonuclease P protein component [Myxococcaceae bacterium]
MANARAFAFPKSARLLSRRDFLTVQDTGHKVSADCVLALVKRRATGAPETRIGFTVSSKVGNAVVRNRVRRRLRQLVRTRRHELPKGLDMVLIARNSAATAEWPAFVRAFERVTSELKKRFPPP